LTVRSDRRKFVTLYEVGSEDKPKAADEMIYGGIGANHERMTARSFKAKCLKVIGEVHNEREAVIIAKRGKPVAKLVPMGAGKDEIFGFLAGKGRIVGDVMSPVLSSEEWTNPSHDLVRNGSRRKRAQEMNQQ
jgi:antitoxin (DNA-binding transcriptional repressor) of toxin-antitoxin stability system